MSDIDIKAARKRLGWSARVLAEHSGVSMRTIQRMELGHCTPLPLLRRAVEQALENGGRGPHDAVYVARGGSPA